MNQTFDDAVLSSALGDNYMHLSNNEKGELIFKEIKNSYVFWSIKKAIKDEIVRHKNTKTQEICDMIPRLLKDLNLETKIKNKVHEILDKNGYFKDTSQITATKFKNCQNMSKLPEYFFDQDHEPLENIAQVRRQWNEHVKTKLLGAVKGSRKPWMRPKKQKKEVKKQEEPSETHSHDDDASSGSGAEMKEFSNAPSTAASTAPKHIAHGEYIYDINQLYDTIIKMNNPNYAGNPSLFWGKIKLNIKTRSLEDLRRKFHELNVTLRQIGLDEEKSFVDERILIGERLLQKDYQPFLVQYAKRGIPSTLRCRIYKKILYSDVTQKEVDNFHNLNDQFQRWEAAIDDILYADIYQICNDDKYFIFQDMIEQCVLIFFRDRQILDMMKSKPHAPIICTSSTERIIGAYPPNGVVPVKKFSSYFAPICFISNSKEDCYYIFRAFYCKYICYMNSISSHPQSIVSLCKLFEDLLQMYEPEVCYHLNHLGISPLKTAFPWIVFMFVGVLEVDQIFQLWDRILGFESLEIVPIFAASIFVFRSNLILNCQNQEDYEELFNDLSMIKVVPLLQHFLFSSGIY